MMKTLALAVLFAGASSHALAKDDYRIRSVDYDSGKVVKLAGCIGFQTMVEFAEDEYVENVGIGDAEKWLVSPNKRGNILFVKPAVEAAHTNLTISTDRRRYHFDLVTATASTCARGDVTYSLRFKYAQEPAATPVAIETPVEVAPPPPVTPITPPVEERHTNYSFTGAPENIPKRVFDAGRTTYFQWQEGTTTPAVYAVASDKSESLVSFTQRGDYLVFDQIAPAFILRRGKATAVLYNDSYQGPTLDAESPQPRGKEKSLFTVKVEGGK